MDLSRRRFGGGGNAVFALLVVGVIVELGAFVWLSHHNHSVAAPVEAAAGATTTPSTTTLSTTTTALPVSPTSISTTAAISGPVAARGSVTYTVAPGTQVVVTATGSCWFEVRHQKGGPVIDDLTLTSGSSKTYVAPVWMRFGNADNVSVTVGSTRLKLPPSPGDLIVSTG